MFLRHAKFDPDKARGRIAAVERWLHDCRNEIGDISTLRGPMFSEMYGQNFLGILGPVAERRTREGAVISVLLPHNMQPLNDPSMLLKWNVWMLSRAVHDPYIQVCGQIVLETFENFSLLHSIRFQQVPHAIMKKNFKFAQECMPFRMRGIWLVHQPKWIGILFALAKPFLSSKLRARVRMFGSDVESLHQLIDPSVLPAAFGGSHPDCGAAWFAAELEREEKEER
ncbi:hypothetical protein GPECTOR_8g338 [Gonium pectorale]|uniref:CRAL-TRIO domain-containing protein n=1 Tax=Gonium pectorale TaxID=33097 RepID=A0A150GSY9_GONPE|nr:hypothetical protein GPECTOR_8g338 [Gonium pectorale]|eukprot:KXZ52965.1 hypothetical protein GPECTOR_8g338 [Gonium pectorale]